VLAVLACCCSWSWRRCSSSRSTRSRARRLCRQRPAVAAEVAVLARDRGLLEPVDFTRKLLNSLIVSLVVACSGVPVGAHAYALGIGRVKGAVVLVFFLVANVLPQEVLVYPLYYIGKSLYMYDSLAIVIIIFTVIQSAFGTYLLSSVYSEFPAELLDAAAVDGAGKWRTLWRVVVPVSRPTLAVLFTFFFIWTWNEFFCRSSS